MNLKQRIENYKEAVEALKSSQSVKQHQENYRLLVRAKARLLDTLLELDSNYDLEQLEKDAS